MSTGQEVVMLYAAARAAPPLEGEGGTLGLKHFLAAFHAIFPPEVVRAMHEQNQRPSDEPLTSSAEAVTFDDAGAAGWVTDCPYCLRTLHIIKQDAAAPPEDGASASSSLHLDPDS